MSRGDSKEKAITGATAPKTPLAIPPHSKLLGFLAFSHEEIIHIIRNKKKNMGVEITQHPCIGSIR